MPQTRDSGPGEEVTVFSAGLADSTLDSRTATVPNTSTANAIVAAAAPCAS
ncbi:hypothetical protein ACFYXV_32885 [Streptomyces sp. NPDC002181]|uniref:hypothetical protein n=1 Tax=Streptomyces sp. NPDC002181 TaxID=3364635 RepID=UPI003690A8DA